MIENWPLQENRSAIPVIALALSDISPVFNGMDGYSRVKLLGEGSFGCVSLMREKKPGGRLVCVKQIHRVHDSNGSAFAPAGRAGVEVDLMKKLRHPNLIRLLGSFVGPSPFRQQYIVMEYCSGGDVRSYLKATSRRNGKHTFLLDEDKIWYWFVQLALGLHCMHQQRVLHRDVKTANIFLSNDGYLVLGDLGIARTLANGGRADTVIGTPLYMAPEVFDGKEYSFSSDVWALGCVLYEFCTGKPPFMANNSVHLMNKICHGDYLPIQKGGNLATSRLPTLIASMLNIRPDRRPSVDQLLRDSIARVHIRHYCLDRLHSTSMTQEERRVLLQQITALGIEVGSSTVTSGGNKTLSENSVTHMNMGSYSGHKLQLNLNRENQEQKLMGVRKRERQQQIRIALEKLRLQIPVPGHPEQGTDSNSDNADPPSVAPINLIDVTQRQSLHDDRWRDPIHSVSNAPKSAGRKQSRISAHLGRSNSVPKELIFTGIPRLGVPLTGMAKTFAVQHPVCHDVRLLRKREAAKAAECYKRRLAAMDTPR